MHIYKLQFIILILFQLKVEGQTLPEINALVEKRIIEFSQSKPNEITANYIDSLLIWESTIEQKTPSPYYGNYSQQRQYEIYHEQYLAQKRHDSIRHIFFHIRDSLHNAKMDKMSAKYRQELIKKWGITTLKKLDKHQVWVGMSDDMCGYALLDPDDRKTTHTAKGNTDVWIYYGQLSWCKGMNGCPVTETIITFKDHKAISITTSN